MVTNEKKNSRKRVIAWISLIILVSGLLMLNYVKFFKAPNKNIEERPVESSSATAIQTALEDIVKNFNNSEELNNYANQGIKMKATLNQYSIFINYITDTTVTYEFSYSNLNLSITVDNEDENVEKFHQVYSLLLKAIQKRINNDDGNLDSMISNVLSGTQMYDGMIIEEKDKIISYQVNITKKLDESNVSDINNNNDDNNNSEDNLENDELNNVENNNIENNEDVNIANNNET